MDLLVFFVLSVDRRLVRIHTQICITQTRTYEIIKKRIYMKIDLYEFVKLHVILMVAIAFTLGNPSDTSKNKFRSI